MRRFTSAKARARLIGAITAGVAAATLLAIAVPAHAALPDSNWTEFQPADNDLSPTGPQSCVPGTQFCLVITGDLADNQNDLGGEADLVTNDAGKTWTAYNNLFPTVLAVSAVSCTSPKVCVGLQGDTATGLVQTTDGGVTWKAWEPSAWAALKPGFQVLYLTAIDCIAGTDCWVGGIMDSYGTVTPYLARISNGKPFPVSLPVIQANGVVDPYGLYGLSCASALSCVAVGFNRTTQASVEIWTDDGGQHWRLATTPADGVLTAVSCVRTSSGFFFSPTATCFAVGYENSEGTKVHGASILVSHDGGRTWTTQFTGDDGWSLGSISCANANRCWATTNTFTQTAMVGTADGGKTWTQQSSNYPNGEYSAQVSALNANTWVATTAADIFVTTDDGGLAG